MPQISLKSLLVLCVITWLLLDLILITKLNIVRLYPIFPANFYFSYGSIAVYTLLAVSLIGCTKTLNRLPLIYIGFVIYSVLIGILYENNNAVSDVRNWILGGCCLIIFSIPEVMKAVVNLKNYLLHTVLFSEVLIAVVLILFPGLLGFSGYGLGVPAYLLAFYLARANYVLAIIAFILTVHQGKRGFILSAIVLVLVALYMKDKRSFKVIMAAGIVAIVFVAFNLNDYKSMFGPIMVDLVDKGDIIGIAQFLSHGRVYELLDSFKLFEGIKWITGLGVGFEFERFAFNGNSKGMTGYVHSTPFNYYLVGGVLGLAFIAISIWRSFFNGLRVARVFGRYEPLFISVIAFCSCFFSFWSAVSPWFWIFIAFGITSTNSIIYNNDNLNLK